MICGVEACNLGAMIHGAELRIHFLKSFQKVYTCENLSQKGLKIKKDGLLPASLSFPHRHDPRPPLAFAPSLTQRDLYRPPSSCPPHHRIWGRTGGTPPSPPCISEIRRLGLQTQARDAASGPSDARFSIGNC
jgi:hypothetical protein